VELNDGKKSNEANSSTSKPSLPPGSVQLNRQRKMDFKKMKKQRRRAGISDYLCQLLSSTLLWHCGCGLGVHHFSDKYEETIVNSNVVIKLLTRSNDAQHNLRGRKESENGKI